MGHSRSLGQDLINRLGGGACGQPAQILDNIGNAGRGDEVRADPGRAGDAQPKKIHAHDLIGKRVIEKNRERETKTGAMTQTFHQSNNAGRAGPAIAPRAMLRPRMTQCSQNQALVA